MAGGYFVSITHQKIGILSAEIEAVSSQLGLTHKQLAEMSSQEDQEIAAGQREIQDWAARPKRNPPDIGGGATEERTHPIQSTRDALAGQIRELSNLSLYMHPMDTADAKYLFSVSPPLGMLLENILDSRTKGVSFSPTNTPDTGFDSPGFAEYILNQVRSPPVTAFPDATLKALEKITTPQLGDIIEYETGLDMFLLRDRRGAQFVIGMTRTGIMALNPNYAKQTIALRTSVYRWSPITGFRWELQLIARRPTGNINPTNDWPVTDWPALAHLGGLRR
jgi:hypothetical protein